MDNISSISVDGYKVSIERDISGLYIQAVAKENIKNTSKIYMFFWHACFFEFLKNHSEFQDFHKY